MNVEKICEINKKSSFVSSVSKDFFEKQKMGIDEIRFSLYFYQLATSIVEDIHCENKSMQMLEFKYKLLNAVFKDFYEKAILISLEIDDLASVNLLKEKIGILI